MRNLSLLLLLLAGAGCATPAARRGHVVSVTELREAIAELERQVDELAAAESSPAERLGGPEASAPIASVGWVPTQAARQSFFGALPNTRDFATFGVTLDTAQTIAGAKTFSNAITSTYDPGAVAGVAALKFTGAGSGDNAILIEDAARIGGKAGASGYTFFEFNTTSMNVNQNFSAAGTVTASQGLISTTGAFSDTVTSTNASGGNAYVQATGAFHCYDGPSCTKSIRFDTVQLKVSATTNFDQNLNVSDTLTTTKGPRFNTGGGGSKPTCDSSVRGMVWYVASGAGVLDTFELCRKDAGDAYAWTTLL